MGRKKNTELLSHLLTGIPGIDKQHAEILFLCDTLQNRIEKENPSPELVNSSIQIIQEIMSQFKSHIVTEENLLEMIGFPGMAGHKAEHRKIFSKLNRKLKALEKSRESGFGRVACAFRETLRSHVDISDREYIIHIDKLMSLKKKYKISSLRAQVLVE